MANTELAKAMLEIFPDAKIFTCEMLYEKEVNEFIEKIEQDHKAAGNSTLIFK